MDRERKKPVVNSSVKLKKEPLGKKLFGMFFTSDFNSVKSWVIEDKLIPGAKNLFLDTLSMMLTGDTRRSSRTNYSNSSRIIVGSSDRNETRKMVARARFDYRDIEFQSREDAMDVVDALKSDLKHYDRGVSILDLADYAGKADVCSDTDDNYGWRDLPDPTRDYVMQTSTGYMLKLPPVVVLPR